MTPIPPSSILFMLQSGYSAERIMPIMLDSNNGINNESNRLRRPADPKFGRLVRLRGLDPAGAAEIVQVARFGADALNIVFRVNDRIGERLLYRGEEIGFKFIEAGPNYAFEADGGLLRPASEAYRIRPPTSSTPI
jgi:hypothetical protein